MGNIFLMQKMSKMNTTCKQFFGSMNLNINLSTPLSIV